MQETPCISPQNASASQSKNMERWVGAVLSALAAVPALGSDANGSWDGRSEIDDDLVIKRYADLTEAERQEVKPVIERLHSILCRQGMLWRDAAALIEDLQKSTWRTGETESDSGDNT